MPRVTGWVGTGSSLNKVTASLNTLTLCPQNNNPLQLHTHTLADVIKNISCTYISLHACMHACTVETVYYITLHVSILLVHAWFSQLTYTFFLYSFCIRAMMELMVPLVLMEDKDQSDHKDHPALQDQLDLLE